MLQKNMLRRFLETFTLKMGYKGVPKAVEAFLHDKQHGQFCRLTHRF